MNTQEIVNELTKYDRLVITEIFLKQGKYSRRYIDYMFTKGRKRTELFRKVVQTYWNNKRQLTENVEGFIHELKNKEELV